MALERAEIKETGESEYFAGVNLESTLEEIKRKIGTGELPTTDKTLIGAINEAVSKHAEYESSITDLQDNKANKTEVEKNRKSIESIRNTQYVDSAPIQYILSDFVDRYEYGRNSINVNTNNPHYPQSGVYTKDNCYVQLWENYGVSSVNKNGITLRMLSEAGRDGSVTLREYDLSTATQKRTMQIPEGWHANSACYDPDNNCIYIAPYEKVETVGGGGTPAKFLLKVDYETGDTIQMTTTRQYSGIAYDRKDKAMYGLSFSGIYRLLVIDDVVKIEAKIFDVDIPSNTSRYQQSIGVHGGVIYIAQSHPNSIVVYSKIGEYIKTINIPKYDKYGHILCELESLTFNDDGECYLSFAEGTSYDIPLQSILTLCKSNLTKGIGDGAASYTDSQIYIQDANYSKIYINTNSATLREIGTADYPIRSIYNALHVKRNYGGKGEFEIVGGKYPFVFVDDMDFMITSSSSCTIYGIRIIRGDFCCMSSGVTIGSSPLYPAAFSSDGGTIVMRSINVDGGGRDYAIRICNGIFKGYGSTVKNFTSYAMRCEGTEVRGNINISGVSNLPKFQLLEKSTVDTSALTSISNGSKILVITTPDNFYRGQFEFTGLGIKKEGGTVSFGSKLAIENIPHNIDAIELTITTSNYNEIKLFKNVSLTYENNNFTHSAGYYGTTYSKKTYKVCDVYAMFSCNFDTMKFSLDKFIIQDHAGNQDSPDITGFTVKFIKY